jgi:hypothetical protein
MLSVLSFIFACQTMENPGAMFSQVAIAKEATSVVAEEPQVEETVDPMFQSNEGLIVSSLEDKAEGSNETVEGVEEQMIDTEDAPEEQNETVDEEDMKVAKVPAAPQSMRVSRVKDGWRPTLIASMMEGPTPRAILALPGGEEKIVKAGDLLADEGVVVMTIGASFVELAVINSEEGRAKIENLTLTAQF